MPPQDLNTGLVPEPYDRNGEETTPTTPRPSTAPNLPQPPTSHIEDVTTPTKSTFGKLADQRPLPDTEFPKDLSLPETKPSKTPMVRNDSGYSAKSANSGDVDMDDESGGEEEEGSDEEGETVNADGTKSSKKKKTVRFYCLDYPPCNLSFTRSEHLARHIRKHTGERPFQCHCQRRFSRLDNLRQHAQTVHVNEDIPNDSLAASGSRYQRHLRTERVRPPNTNRVRAGTAGSVSGQGRGHQRNSLSTSSIASISSTYSTQDDVRRRPPPLVMANSGNRLSDSFSSATEVPGQYAPYSQQSPSGYSTPTSATFSTGQSSPRWGSGMQSPISAYARPDSVYAPQRTPQRRLSVPSGANPFQSPRGYGPPSISAMSNSTAQPLYSHDSGSLASPTVSSSGSSWLRRDSMGQEDYRRRTWHPDSHRGYYQNPPSNFDRPVTTEHPPAHLSNSQNNNNVRLPGIESFLNRPVTPVQRVPSPMDVEYTPSKLPTVHASPYSRTDDRQNQAEWENAGMHTNFSRIRDQGFSAAPQSRDATSAWASDVDRAVQAQADQVRTQQPADPPREPAPTTTYQHHHVSAPPLTPRESKRAGWYNGPLARHPAVTTQVREAALAQTQAQRTSPEGSSSSEGGIPGTPGSAVVGDYHPGIVHANEHVEQRSQPRAPYNAPPPAGYYGAAYPGSVDPAAYGYGAVPEQRPVAAYQSGAVLGVGHHHQHGFQHGQPVGAEKRDEGTLRLDALVAVAEKERGQAF